MNSNHRKCKIIFFFKRLNENNNFYFPTGNVYCFVRNKIITMHNTCVFSKTTHNSVNNSVYCVNFFVIVMQ